MQVAVLQSSLPNLQELHVAGNNISRLHVQQEQQQPQQQDWPPLVGFKSLQVGSIVPFAACKQANVPALHARILSRQQQVNFGKLAAGSWGRVALLRSGQQVCCVHLQDAKMDEGTTTRVAAAAGPHVPQFHLQRPLAPLHDLACALIVLALCRCWAWKIMPSVAGRRSCA